MPPAKTIIVDTNLILSNIRDIVAQQTEEAHRKADAAAQWRRERTVHNRDVSDDELNRAADAAREETLTRELPAALLVPRDLELLTDMVLTPSWRIRTQQAVKRLETEGFIALQPRWITLTDKGKAAAGPIDG